MKFLHCGPCGEGEMLGILEKTTLILHTWTVFHDTLPIGKASWKIGYSHLLAVDILLRSGGGSNKKLHRRNFLSKPWN